MGTEIHWLAILLATLAGFAVGAVWYSVLFGKAWMAARGVTMDQAKASGAKPGVMFGITLLLDLVMAFVLDHVFGTYAPIADLQTALMIAGGVALGFVIPTMAVNYLYQQAKRALFLIDAGHWFCAYLVMGAVLYLMR